MVWWSMALWKMGFTSTTTKNSRNIGCFSLNSCQNPIIFYHHSYFWEIEVWREFRHSRTKTFCLTRYFSKMGRAPNIDPYIKKGNICQGGSLLFRGLECHIPILKSDFFKNPFRIIPWLLKRVLHLVWALYYVYIVVEMTLNMAK